MIKHVSARNILAFSQLDTDVSKGLNIIIGDNGTGKTQFLKLTFFCSDTYSIDEANWKMYEIEGAFSTKTSKMLNDASKEEAYFKVSFDEGESEFCYFPIEGMIGYEQKMKDFVSGSVYIPEKDLLTQSRGLLAMAKKYGTDFPFKEFELGIIEKAQAWKLEKIPEIGNGFLSLIEKAIGGTVEYESDTFFIKKPDGRMVEFSLASEGHKRFALLWQLIMNESIVPGSILFWDEPDANMNPKHIPLLVEALLLLQRRGVQIFLTTHNYILAKYFDIKKKEGDKVSFLSFYSQDGTIQCERSEDFASLAHNDIMDAFSQLLEEVYHVQE